MLWHDRLYLIDHGAALYFHHGWDGDPARADAAFPMIRDHVLLPHAGDVGAADAALAARLDIGTIRTIVAQVPDGWLQTPDAFADPDAQRTAYVDYLVRRLQRREAFVAEIEHARG